jgi:Terpene synthase family, metal binding domain.
MAKPSTEVTQLLSAAECGSTCAVAGLAQRDLLRCAAAYPALFPARPFDPAFFSTITLANAFCAPWLSADQLRVTNRTTLWVFALDRLIDQVATQSTQVEDIVRRCLRAAGEDPVPDDPLTMFLAEIRDELAGTASFPAMRELWTDELRRMLEGMAREWHWKSARPTDPPGRSPTLDAYLDNAEFGFSLVYVSHWIATTPPGSLRDVPELRAAGQAVQRVIRLLNDLGTVHRERQTGDLNALLLTDRATVEQRIVVETANSHQLLTRLRPGHPWLTGFLERHLDFNAGFYRVTDYQGEL